MCRGIYLLGGRDIGSFEQLAYLARLRVVPNGPSPESVDPSITIPSVTSLEGQLNTCIYFD